MPLTTQESTELLKLVNSNVILAGAMKKVAAAFNANQTVSADPTLRAHLKNAFGGLFQTIQRQGAAAGYIIQCTPDIADFRAKTYPYPKNLTLAWGELDSIWNGAVDYYNIQLDALGTAYQTIKADIASAASLSQSFDRTLAFNNPLPFNYPTVIGPHGDYDKTMQHLFFVNEYFEEGLNAVYAVMLPDQSPTWPVEANAPLGIFMDAAADAWNRWTRATFLAAQLETAGDAAIISTDNAKGTGLRPREFFRALLVGELLVNQNVENVPFSGRKPEESVSKSMATMLGTSNQLFGLLQPVNPKFVSDQLTKPGGLDFDTGTFWSNLDGAAWGLIGFFYVIPLPPVPLMDGGTNPPTPGGTPNPTPSTIPVGYFDTEISDLDQIIADASAAKAALTAKIGTQV